MSSPYQDLPARAFWRTGVVEQEPSSIDGLYRKKFDIAATDAVATAGSCFAQHIARNLRHRGFEVLDAEPAPPGMGEADAKRFGHGIYSARYGNIYVVRQLVQLLREMSGRFEPQNWIWERDGRFYDALRPSVEPNGLGSPDEVRAHRAQHLRAVRSMLRRADVFVFTFGLTESWIDRESGTVFPTAPGTIAGAFDPECFAFTNFRFAEILGDFVRVRRALKRMRPTMRFIVTVSPVPLTATASGQHVLPATVYSKSVLRAVAGQLHDEFDDVDYFPSYELIASHVSRGSFYANNLRSVTDAGVAAAMAAFFAEHGSVDVGPSEPAPTAAAAGEEEDDVVCEDLLLEAFAK